MSLFLSGPSTHPLSSCFFPFQFLSLPSPPLAQACPSSTQEPTMGGLSSIAPTPEDFFLFSFPFPTTGYWPLAIDYWLLTLAMAGSWHL